MRRFRRSLAIPVFAVLLASLCSAQQAPSVTTSVPNLIRYGGTLKDTQGVPLASSTVGVTFSIYKQQDGGAALWMETQNVNTDTAGSYSVLLGNTTATGLPSDLFSLQEERWLGVQVQGQAEQPRIMLVSVPYAFKAHEAETLAGRSISDFVLATNANSAANAAGNPATPAAADSQSTQQVPTNAAINQGPTNFSGSTTDQIVKVTQSGTGAGITASANTNAIYGLATGSTGNVYGVQGVATGTGGVALLGNANNPVGGTFGIKGSSASTSGTGMRGLASASSGNTIGVSSQVNSPNGIAAVFNSAAGGKIISGQNNAVEKFSVDGAGNVNSSGNFTGSGTGLTGIQFTQLAGQLGSSQLSGTYSSAVSLSNAGNSFAGSGAGLTGIPFANLSGTLGTAQLSGTYTNAVTLSSSSNSFTGNGAGLTGVMPAGGSANYIQNTMTQQMGMVNFNINGSGVLTGTLVANAGLSGVSTIASGNAVSGMATVASGSANGVFGQTASSGGSGVYGNATATGGAPNGVYGQTASNGGSGVYGKATATSGTTFGVFGQTASSGGTGVYGANTATSGNAYGVAGYTASNSSNASAIYGQASATTGNTNGVTGKSLSATGVGVYGWASSTTGNDSGMVGQTDSTTDFASGVFGVATASSGQTYGTVGSTNSTSQNASGVYGNATATTGATNGVFGQTYSSDGNADGVYGLASATTGGAAGVVGATYGPNGSGVEGVANTAGGFSEGVAGINRSTSGDANGIYGQTNSGGGVAGYFDNYAGGYILVGTINGNGTHMFHVDGSGDGYFAGNLQVGGTLSKGGGSFKIDDPLDPANKTLSHSFVESPDMMNIYNGNVATDKRGMATVSLPEYFEVLNRDFRYQLTVIGRFAQAIVAQEVSHNRFVIQTSKPGVKVSWQVTGIRQDAWANAHRIPVEEEKPEAERGKYLHPDLYGASADRITDASLQH